ncbi:MAG: lipid droplet-associated protein, partial [Actinomycetota bacterium]|nr:lipid droplet-associated protein [Actinomycetota bacterium]
MSPLPLPVRVAAGLAVTALDQARRLPTQLVTLPVTVVSRALQAGMRVQQHVTELAIKGDEVFAHLRPVDENPLWARFDEDFHDDGAGDGENPLATVLSGPGSARLDDVDLTDAGEVYSAMAGLATFDELDLHEVPSYDAVVHFAAIPAILQRADAATYATNALSTYHVLEAATR